MCSLHISLKVAKITNQEKTKHDDATIRFLEKRGKGSGGGARVLTCHCSRDPGVTMIKHICRGAPRASIRQMSGQVSRGSAGEYQADERAGVARLSWRVSGR